MLIFQSFERFSAKFIPSLILHEVSFKITNFSNFFFLLRCSSLVIFPLRSQDELVSCVPANKPYLGSRRKLASPINPRWSSKNQEPQIWESEYSWMTYEEVRETAQKVGSGLLSLGLTPNQGVKVGIFSANR